MTPITTLASIPPAEPAARPAAPANASAEERGLWDRMWGKEGFSFGALLDIVNPLQHIPVVSTIYRAITGDTIGPAPRMMGGAIFGGVVGLIASAADSAIEAITGKDTGSHVLAMLPEPDPVSQWAFHDDKRGQRPQMAGLMNIPDGATMLAATDSAADTPSVSADAESARPTAALGGTDALAPLAGAESDADQTPALAANHPLNVPPRSADMGAGGRQVPLAAKGRAGVMPANLPTPQTLAADPALLRDMRQGGAAAIEKPTGRIDTAIKGRGLIAASADGRPKPDGATPPGVANWLDYAVQDPQAITFDAGARAPRDSATSQSEAQRGGPPIPEVSPDFLMKMQQALEKYQSLRTAPAPSIDLSH